MNTFATSSGHDCRGCSRLYAPVPGMCFEESRYPARPNAVSLPRSGAKAVCLVADQITRLQVVANSPIVPTTFASNYRDFAVGTQHFVWGWKTAIRRAMAAATAAI